VRTLVFFALSSLLTASYAQRVVMSNKPQMYERRTLYHKALGENQNGILTLNYSSLDLGDGFNIEWYDPEFRFLQERHIEGPKGQQVIKVFLNQDRIQWLCLDRRKRDSAQLFLYSLNGELEGEIEAKLLDKLPIQSIDLDQVNVDFSADRQFLNFLALADHQSGSQLFLRSFNTREGTLIAARDTVLSLRDNDWYWYASDANNQGDELAVLRLYQSTKSIARSNYDKESFACYWNSEALTVFPVMAEHTIGDLDVIAHPEERLFGIAGLYNGKEATESKGTFRCVVDSTAAWSEELHPWTESVLTLLVGEKARKKGVLPEHFQVRRLFWLSDGSLSLVLEQFYESKQMETYYLNGVPQTSTKTLYTFGDICVALVGRVGLTDTAVLIRKNQVASPSNAFLLGLGVCQSESELHIIYNDDIARSNRVMDAVISTEAGVRRVALLDSENTYSTIVPEDGRQTAYGSFILPIYRDKQWYWMQLLTDD
jgi:hypothetical protein